MGGAGVGVLEEGDEVSLSSLLKGTEGRGLETEVGLAVTEVVAELLGDLTDETLEGELADEQLSGLLVPSDLTKGDSSGPETMGLLDTTSSSLWMIM